MSVEDIVVDAGVLVVALAQDDTAGHRARRRMRTTRPVAPQVIDLEVVSALRGLLRGGKLTPRRAETALRGLSRAPLVRASHGPLLARCWEHREDLTVDDAAYVALAEQLSATLLTTDRRLARATGPRCEIEVLASRRGDWTTEAGGWLARHMSSDETRVVRAEREVDAYPQVLFELIADPAEQPRWDGNDNLGQAAAGQRVRSVGDVFAMTLKSGSVRENHVVEFEEGRRIAWRPSEEGMPPPGHLWRWELEALADGRTLVRHTYDWSQLSDQERFARARATTPERLSASIERLAALAESR